MGTVMSAIDVDYLIMGAGAAGMAFADSLFTESDATMVIVDRHDRPGGHWNDAYPFVRLHQPSANYGVNSAELGTGAIDEVGLNAGFHELASGQEILAHYDNVMRQRFLPSGRVRFLPMSEGSADGVITSLLSGPQQHVASVGSRRAIRGSSIEPPSSRVIRDSRRCARASPTRSSVLRSPSRSTICSPVSKRRVTCAGSTATSRLRRITAPS